jgi:predicted metal-binding membrane protein
MQAFARIRRLGTPGPTLETVGWALAGAAWVVLLLGTLLGWSSLADHHHLLGGHGPVGGLAIVGFLGAWQLMIVAMMLPTAMPAIALFARASRAAPGGGLALAIFVSAYFVVWTAFAILALLGDATLHALVHRLPAIAAREGLVTGSLIAAAGAFQFSELKHRCLDACRNPLHFIWRFYRRGAFPALRLGIRHAAFCVGCCWALMLVMFGVGVGSMLWMMGLTGVMVLERTSEFGRRLVPYVGAMLLVHGGVTMLLEVVRS